MNRRFAFLTLALGVAVVLGSAANANAFFGLRGGSDCCEPTCCAPEPTCCAPEPTCGCEPACCDPCSRPRGCGLLGGLRKIFDRGHGCCEPTCGAPEPTCCAPEPTCCAAEPTCGCEPVCSDPCSGRKGCGLLGCLRGLFHRDRGCCEPTCGCEPSCGFEPMPGCGC